MELWMVGLALAALLALAARDVGRRGDATAAGLAGLRAVGGAGLGAMAVLALAGGSPIAAGIAALGAAPLLAGLAAPAVRRVRGAPACAARGDPRHPRPALRRAGRGAPRGLSGATCRRPGGGPGRRAGAATASARCAR